MQQEELELQASAAIQGQAVIQDILLLLALVVIQVQVVILDIQDHQDIQATADQADSLDIQGQVVSRDIADHRAIQGTQVLAVWRGSADSPAFLATQEHLVFPAPILVSRGFRVIPVPRGSQDGLDNPGRPVAAVFLVTVDVRA